MTYKYLLEYRNSLRREFVLLAVYDSSPNRGKIVSDPHGMYTHRGSDYTKIMTSGLWEYVEISEEEATAIMLSYNKV